MQKIIVANNPEKLNFDLEGVEIVSAKDYLTNSRFTDLKNTRVFNLCNDYRYQSRGYYVSLLAEARGQKPLPSVKHILDLKASALLKMVSADLDELIQHSMHQIKSDEFTLSIYFGQNIAAHYKELCQAFHRYFPVPYLRLRFSHNEKWYIRSARIISSGEIPEAHWPYVKQFAQEYFSRKRYESAKQKVNPYSLGILVKKNDEAPPSNPKALEKFIEIAGKSGFDAELLGPKDLNLLPTFDALFIRMGTHVINESYGFATAAQNLGIALVDYPEAILKCSNKVYLTELMEKAGIATPKSMIIHKDNVQHVAKTLGLPCILKLPDSTFSVGVKKAETEKELEEIIASMLKSSDLIIAQEYCYTDHDWRVCILDEKPLFVCKYYMAKDHWQIYNWQAKKHEDIEGNFDCLPIPQVPEEIISISVKAAKLIGRGLYGIDVKLVNGKPVVIEINDNPNIDFGVEDSVLGDELYQKIIDAFKERIEKKTDLR